MTTYLRNAWYVAGFSDELNAEKDILARRLLGEPVVFFRTADGRIQALQDRCPHRFVPLSRGQRVGDSLQCGYHGLRFDGSGACSLNPHGDGAVPKAAKVRAYRAVDRHGLIWWWAGDAARADEGLIPDVSFTVTRPQPGGLIRGSMPTACDYRYVTDNLLDATHADFLHAGTLGSGLFTKVKPRIEDLDEGTVRISWWATGAPAGEFFARFLRDPAAPADQWLEATWTAPSIVVLRTGATMAGEPRESGFDSSVMHISTPETATTSHYWYWGTINIEFDVPTTEAIQKMARFAFEQQDKPMLEAQQHATGDAPFWSLDPVLLPGDAGAVRARRKLDALIEREGGAPR